MGRVGMRGWSKGRNVKEGLKRKNGKNEKRMREATGEPNGGEKGQYKTESKFIEVEEKRGSTKTY